MVATYLDRILTDHRAEAARDGRPLEALIEAARASEVKRGFSRSLTAADDGGIAVIAEVKRRSPSRGDLHTDLDPAETALAYVAGGASCLSVLTDMDHFGGSPDDLRAARAAVDVPVLRKDFTVDPYQVYETRVLGADCVLLIVAALPPAQLAELHELAREIGLDVLVEVHNARELEIALALDNPMVGINNRDLHSFRTSLETTFSLLPRMGGERLVITESGIRRVDDVLAMRGHGVNAFLVGEAFMRAADPGAQLQALFD